MLIRLLKNMGSLKLIDKLGFQVLYWKNETVNKNWKLYL